MKSATPAETRRRQEDCEFTASLGYTGRANLGYLGRFCQNRGEGLTRPHPSLGIGGQFTIGRGGKDFFFSGVTTGKAALLL